MLLLLARRRAVSLLLLYAIIAIVFTFSIQLQYNIILYFDSVQAIITARCISVCKRMKRRAYRFIGFYSIATICNPYLPIFIDTFVVCLTNRILIAHYSTTYSTILLYGYMYRIYQ